LNGRPPGILITNNGPYGGGGQVEGCVKYVLFAKDPNGDLSLPPPPQPQLISVSFPPLPATGYQDPYDLLYAITKYGPPDPTLPWTNPWIVPGMPNAASTHPNQMVRVGNVTYVVFIGATNHDAMTPGSPTYVVRLDHTTYPPTPMDMAPVFIGASTRLPCCNYGKWAPSISCCAQTENSTNKNDCIVIQGGVVQPTPDFPQPDEHDFPAICADSKGNLHVIIGAHNRQFKYRMGIPGSKTINWGTELPIGEPGCDGMYTYPALACDPWDNLHLVARDGNGALVYLRKPANGDWEPVSRTLVEATWHTGVYTDWYHQLNIDRKGRLFVSYVFFADQLKKKDAQVYMQRWPDEILEVDVAEQSPHPCWGWHAPWPFMSLLPVSDYCWMHETQGGVDSPLKSHDPVILISDDLGDSFRLATTLDFLIGAGLCGASLVPVPAEGPHYVPPWEPVEGYATSPNELPEAGIPLGGWFTEGQ
jgi:hypothetical protein